VREDMAAMMMSARPEGTIPHPVAGWWCGQHELFSIFQKPTTACVDFSSHFEKPPLKPITSLKV
jgi:hypothetical protein